MFLEKKGFTLLELLVSLTIVFVSLSLFLSIAMQVHQKSLQILCKSNLRQLGQALFMYANDYRGCLPHSDRDSDTGRNYCWFDVIDPFLGTANLDTVKQCPATGETKDRHSIKMNGGLSAKERLPETARDRKLGRWYWPRTWSFRKKSQTVLLLDGRMDAPFDTHTGTRRKQPYLDVAKRHLQGANLLFADGSSRFCRQSDIEDRKYVWQVNGK